MVSSSMTTTKRPEARIVIDSVNPTFARISIYEIENGAVSGHINLDVLMDESTEKIFPKSGARLFRQRSGGLYLYGPSGREELKELLASKGYKSISMKEPGHKPTAPQSY
jgi:hypothetical protein